MFQKILDIINGLLSWLTAARRKAEQKVADDKAGLDTIRRANEAAKKAEVEQEESGYVDPNDRDAR